MGRTISESHSIDQRAQNVFKSAISDVWLVREQHPDVHIDYIVEIVENGEPSGIQFCVQLKGAKNPKYSKKKQVVSYPFKVKPLVYYLEKVKHPVFFVLIDITTKKGYWLFLQKYLKKIGDEKVNWKDKKTLYVSVPLSNELENKEGLYKAIKNSEEYMKNLWPSTIFSAIENEKKQLEQLDSRIEVDVTHINSRTIFNFVPKEKVTLGISLNSDKIDLFKNGLDKGLVTRFDRHDINISGSKLIEKFFEKSEFLDIGFGTKREANVILRTLDKRGNKKNDLDISGYLIAGRKEIRFETILPNSFNINFSIPIEHIKSQNEFNIQFIFNPSWEGQLLETLPYFDKHYSFVHDLAQNCAVNLSCEIKGNYIFGGSCKLDDSWISIAESLSIIQKARFISKSIDDDLVFPLEGITYSDAETISILYDILNNGKYTFSAVGAKITAILPAFKENISMAEGTMKYEESEKIVLLGKELPWNLIRTFTHIRLVTDISNVRNNKNIPLEWEGLSKAEAIYTISRV